MPHSATDDRNTSQPLQKTLLDIVWILALWLIGVFVLFTSVFVGFNYSSTAGILRHGLAPLLMNWKPAGALIFVVALALYLAFQIHALLQHRSTVKHGRIALTVLSAFTLIALSVWIFPGWIQIIDYRTEISKIEIATRLVPRVVAMLPSLQSILLESPIYLIYGGLTGVFAGWLKIRYGLRTAYTRKIFHVFIFTMAGFLQIVRGIDSVVLFGGAIFFCVVYAVIEGEGFAFYEAMARPGDQPRRSLFVLIPLVTTALGGIVANLFFYPYAFVGYLASGWGDAIGEPVGSRWGRHRYRVPSLAGIKAERSWEGSLAVFCMSTFGILLTLCIVQVPCLRALWIGAVCGAVTAVVEGLSSHGLDNLTVQVAAAATAFLLLAV